MKRKWRRHNNFTTTSLTDLKEQQWVIREDTLQASIEKRFQVVRLVDRVGEHLKTRVCHARDQVRRACCYVQMKRAGFEPFSLALPAISRLPVEQAKR